jgi:hypothetical protein
MKREKRKILSIICEERNLTAWKIIEKWLQGDVDSNTMEDIIKNDRYVRSVAR